MDRISRNGIVLLIFYLSSVIVNCCPRACKCWKSNTYIRCTKSDLQTTYHIQETVKMLDLSNTGLEIFPTEDLKRLKGLETLNLSANKIRHVPSNLSSHFPKLKTLHLDGNHLEVINSLQGLQEINFLDLSGNKIKKIVPFAFYNLNNLKVLRLSENKITEIPPKAFYGLFELTWLDLSGNSLIKVDKNSFHWPRSKLRSLYLNDNNLEYIPDGTFASAKELEIYLRNNRIRNISDNAFHESTRLVDLRDNKLITLPVLAFKDLSNAKINIQGNYLACNSDLMDNLRKDLSFKDKYNIGNCSSNGFVSDEKLPLFTAYNKTTDQRASPTDQPPTFRPTNPLTTDHRTKIPPTTLTLWSWVWVMVVLSCIVFLLVLVSIVIVLMEMRRFRYLRFQGCNHSSHV